MKIKPNTRLFKYVIHNLSRELEEVKTSEIVYVKSDLSLEERTLIYKYTEDGYEQLNERLRVSKGKDISEFGKLLDKTMAKLPDYEDITFRAADLTDIELQNYLSAHENNGILVEHSFVSTSKSKVIAYGFGKTCRFTIVSKSGKDIEPFAKYGAHHPQNEKEVLFRPNTRFKVLEVTKEGKYTLITLEETRKK
jgi:hypothetical protein